MNYQILRPYLSGDRSLLSSSYTKLPSSNSQNRSAFPLNLASDFATVVNGSHFSISTSVKPLVYNTASNPKMDPRRVVHHTISNSTGEGGPKSWNLLFSLQEAISPSQFEDHDGRSQKQKPHHHIHPFSSICSSRYNWSCECTACINQIQKDVILFVWALDV